jgi:hypothetical protein
MRTMQAVPIGDDSEALSLVRSPNLRAGLALLAMDEIHEALRHRRVDFAEPGVMRGRCMLAAVG